MTAEIWDRSLYLVLPGGKGVPLEKLRPCPEHGTILMALSDTDGIYCTECNGRSTRKERRIAWLNVETREITTESPIREMIKT